MHLPPFEYLDPRGLDELVELLQQHRGNARILAGGTDLVPQLLRSASAPEFLIDIQHVRELRSLAYDSDSGLTLGAMVTFAQILASDIVRDKFHALHQGAAVVGSPQIRAMGTIGGNSCFASPCADTPPPLVVLGASVNLLSHRGRRQMLLEDFILDKGKVALEPDELLESFTVPEPKPASASRYQVMGLREAVEIDLASVAVHCAVDRSDDRVTELRIAMGSVAAVPMRPKGAEQTLLGKVPSAHLIEQAARHCAAEAQPIDDLRASAAYRREVVRVLFRRTFDQAFSAIH